MSEPSDRQRQNLEVARAGVEAYQRGDIEAVLAMTAEDNEIFLPPTLPNSGTFRGHEGFLTWVGQWLEAWEEFAVEVRDIEPVGDRHVVATMRQSARGKGSGIPVEMEIFYMWEIRGDEILAMHLYPTREEAMDAAERREGQVPE
jgi:ketosteroid isomerase-like protein